VRPVILIPGIHNSGPGHWQSLWQLRHPDVTRLSQHNWDQPVCEEWVASLDRAVVQAAVPPILVAHSLGCLVATRWAARSPRSAHAMLLVAVPDPDGPEFPREAVGFSAIPPSLNVSRIVVVSSANDPYATQAFTEACVRTWNARHINLGNRGHINAESGMEDWAEGWALAEGWRAE
jgi:predicted alpha/beta hydrolase family esterase